MRVIWGLCALMLAVAVYGGAAAQDLRPTPVAWFTDNGDRQALQALRDKPEADLSQIERAILTAANRVGWIKIPACRRASNAILIRVGDRDAVVTSRHLVAGKWRGDSACAADDPAFFVVNASYLTPGLTSQLTLGDQQTEIALHPGPLNYAPHGLMMEPAEDWLVYFLTETISDKPMPAGAYGAGQPRGAVQFSTRRPPNGQLYIIGYDGRFDRENGWQFSWQSCPFVQEPPKKWQSWRGSMAQPGTIYFGCDAAPGASSSLLATLEGDELTMQGLVTAVMDRLTGTDIARPALPLLWNMGTSAVAVEAAVLAAQ